MEEIISYLKERLLEKGEGRKKNQNQEVMRDCIGLVDAVNRLEHRLHGHRITDITFII